MAIDVTPVGFINSQSFGLPVSTLVERSEFHQCLEDDLCNAFFRPEDFSEPVTYMHATGENAVYYALHNTPHFDANPDVEVGITDVQMIIRLQQSKLLRAPCNDGDKAIIRGKMYQLKDFEPDGVGTVELHMSKAGQ